MATHIVTGASRGVGEAIAAEFLKRGDRVVAIARGSSKRLEELAGPAANRLFWYHRDLSDPAVAGATIDELWAGTPIAEDNLITLFAAAAVVEPIGTAGAPQTAEIDRAIRLNLTAPVAMAHRLLAKIGDTGPPVRIVLLSSGASLRPMPGLGVYGASKAALNAFVATTRAEFEMGRSGASAAIWAVSPGVVDTAMQESLRTQGSDALPGRETYRRWYEEGTLLSPEGAAKGVISVIEREDIAPGSYVHADDL